MLRPANEAEEEARALDEASTERFDRVAFAHRALDLLRPRHMTIAVCEGSKRLHVESGRWWGRAPDERWAIVAVPPTVSRRAIALAVAEIAGHRAEPYALDALLAAVDDPSI